MQHKESSSSSTQSVINGLSSGFIKEPSELQLRKNATWSKGSIWLNNSRDVYLNYRYADKKIEFTINGGTDRLSCITLQVSDKETFDKLSLRLVDLGFDLSENNLYFFAESPYNVDINDPTAEQITLFINEVDKIYPIPNNIKEVIANYAETLAIPKQQTISNIQEALDELSTSMNTLALLQNQMNTLEQKIGLLYTKIANYAPDQESNVTLESTSLKRSGSKQ